MKPLSDRVLVQLDEVRDVSEGGIILPDQAREIAFSGLVLAVGSKTKEVKVGDKLFIGKYAGVQLDYNGKKCLIIKEEDALGVMEVE